MSEFNKLMRQYLDEQASSIHTAILGKIVKISNNKAQVEPMHEGYPLLIGVPMIKQSYNYAVGNTVLVVFLERPIDGVGFRRHSLDDGIIVGKLA